MLQPTNKLRIHLIAIGGAAMHNIAIALQNNGHTVSGSDDEIYDPARARLAKVGLLPQETGWFPDLITSDLDMVILGMHARADNPELLRAQEIGLKVYSYPTFIYQHALHKTRLVVAGSHGKTTTTAMVMHVLRKAGVDFDYLVGAQLDGFETMVRLSDAPVMVIEGDEYLSSALEPVSKMVQYRPHHAVITGIAWDHINVFPTFESYLAQFRSLIHHLEPNGSIIWFADDPHLQNMIAQESSFSSFQSVPFEAFHYNIKAGKMWLERTGKPAQALSFFGEHNLRNARAAYLLCAPLGISEDAFVEHIADFKGASKRLQWIAAHKHSAVWLDFAHAPSKVKATVQAVKSLFPDRKLTACLELHTFSSLTKAFLPEYAQSLAAAEQAVVFFSPHTLEMKKMPPFTENDIQVAFEHPNLKVFTTKEALLSFLEAQIWLDHNLLMMSSGTFGGLNFEQLKQLEP
jgi:UDP-N-acetylmuramate: L-alanyl-gamma-D-glutamyl-meso-diaminopimelate ligase